MNKASSDELESATGTEIQWIEGKNITVKQIKKKQKHKSIYIYIYLIFIRN